MIDSESLQGATNTVAEMNTEGNQAHKVNCGVHGVAEDCLDRLERIRVVFVDPFLPGRERC